MSRLAGDERYGWVWSDTRGLHLHNTYMFDRFADYTIVGGTETVVARRQCLDGINILIAKMIFDPPHVAVYHFNRTERLDMDVTDTCLFIASRRGLEVYSLDKFQFLNIYPGSFCAVSAVDNNLIAVSSVSGTVSFLHYDIDRWEPSIHAVHVESSLLNHRIMVSSYARPWCPQHKHRLKFEAPGDCILGTCDGLTPTYISQNSNGTNTVYIGDKICWSFKAQAVDLRKQTIIMLHSQNTVQIWPRLWWGTRLAVLYLRADFPVELLLKLKKLLLS